MSLAGLIHRNNYLCRKLTQIHNALKGKDKQHGSSCDRAQLPLLTLPFSFMKMDSGGEVETVDFTHTSSVLGLPARSWAQESPAAWKACEGREKLSRRIWVLGEHFTWPQPGSQHGGQRHSCSQICCQVQNCLTKAEQMDQWGLVAFLHLECKEVSITRYFLATSSETLECCALVTARDKQLMRKRNNKDGGLCRQVSFSQWPENLHRLSRYFLKGGKK